MASRIEPILTKAAKSVSQQVAKKIKHYKKMAKADLGDYDDEEAAAAGTAISLDLDLSPLRALIDVTPEYMQSVVGDSGNRALAQLGVFNRGDLVNQVDAYANDYAASRAAELVGMKYINGKLVDNPDADWSIPQATRDELRGIIADAFAGRIDPDQIETAITNAGSFSPERAELIARTEITRANSYGSLEGYKAARDGAGITVRKQWLPDDGACPICLDNAADGIIELDEQFSSGDDAPPAHPNCECAISPVTGENDDETATEDDG